MNLPRLLPDPTGAAPKTDCVVLAVYAPFGTDETLSTFPDGSSQTLAQHPLYRGLLKVAEQGVHAVALIDRVDDDTWLVEVPALKPADARVVSRWKQDMGAPRNLAGFLRHVHGLHPGAAIVLALEGHGAGYLPEIDRRQLSTATLTENGRFEWRISGDAGAPVLPQGSPLLPQGSPLLPQGSPLLPQGSPLLPSNHLPLSTWGLGEALRLAVEAGVPKPAVIHFDNCFNMSVELLHTIAPYAEVATGYPNYNFFTAGQPYPAVFTRLRNQGSASAEQLATWFAEGNRDVLAAKGNHPTAGCTVRLARMGAVAEGLDDLADALLAALRSAPTAAARAAVVAKIRTAIIRAQQYDTGLEGFGLETPDEMTDLSSLATALLQHDFRPHPVAPACQALLGVLKGIKVYGAVDRPWVDPSVQWNFSSDRLAMNIFLPDPVLRGIWDWRSPFYLQVNPDPGRPLVQPHVIDLLKATDWVDFIIEYHRDAPWVRLLPAAIPEFPVFNAKFVPPDKTTPGTRAPTAPGTPTAPTGGSTPPGTAAPSSPTAGPAPGTPLQRGDAKPS